MSEPFIRKGERVIWDDQLIATANRDIVSGERIRTDAWDWAIDPPISGGPIPKGFRVNTWGAHDAFVEGEWATERRARNDKAAKN